MRSQILTMAVAATAALADLSPVRADPVAAAVYPVDVGRASSEDASDVRALLDSALQRTWRRGGFVPAEDLARAACGRASTAAPACLGRLAGAGVVLTVVVDRETTQLVVVLRAVDGAGRVHGPVTATVDSYLQNADVLVRALFALDERRMLAGAPPQPPRADPAEPRPAPAPATASPLAVTPPRPAPPRFSSPPRSAPSGAWRGTAGGWTTAAGLALLAAGGVTAYLNRQVADELDDRFRRNALEPADAARYRSVDRNNTLAIALLVGGGVATTGGLVLWATAPDSSPDRRGATFGVRGRF